MLNQSRKRRIQHSKMMPMGSSVLFSKAKIPYLILGFGVAAFLFYMIYVGVPFMDGSGYLTIKETNGLVLNSHELISLKHLLSACVSIAENGGEEVYRIRKAADGLHEKSKGETREGVNDPLTDGDIRSHNQMYFGLKKLYPNVNVISEERSSLPEDMDEIRIANSELPSVSSEVSVGDILVPIDDITVWIDPLDATTEYTENLLHYVTTMACVAVKGKPTIGVIHKPFNKTTMWGWVGKGISSSVQNLLESKHPLHRNNKFIIVSRSHAGKVETVAKEAIGADSVIIPAGGAGYKSLELISGSVDAYIHTTLIKKWDICAGNAILNSVNGRMTTLNGKEITYGHTENFKNEGGLLATLRDHEFFEKKLSVLIKR